MSKESSVTCYPKKQRKASRKAHQKYKILFEEEKNKKRQYGFERYKNFPEDEKQKLVESRKNIKHGKIKMLHK